MKDHVVPTFGVTSIVGDPIPNQEDRPMQHRLTGQRRVIVAHHSPIKTTRSALNHHARRHNDRRTRRYKNR